MPSSNDIPPEDLRETLFRKHCKDYVLDLEGAKQFADEYFTIRAKELLEWMWENDVECNSAPENYATPFFYKGEWITAEQLFENFL